MNKNEKNAIVKWTIFISLGVLLLGGLNYLLMGLFQFNLFGEIFGFYSLAGRIAYSIFGVSALILLSVIIWRVYMKQEAKKPASTSTATRSSTSTAK